MITLNLTLPTCWQELTQTQMRYVFFLMTQNYTADEVKTFCLCRFGGLQVLERTDTGYIVRYENISASANANSKSLRYSPMPDMATSQMSNNPHNITAVQIAEQLPRLAWLDELPLVPLRLAQIGKHNAVAADLSGVPFADYLYCDNLYTGYLQTQKDALLVEMAGKLYNAPDIALSPEETISIFYWFASLKAYYQRRFRYLFAPNTDGNLHGDTASMADKLQSAMDNQIRALTKGDVTKEEQVLAADTIRALTELDAMAHEYQELQKEMKR